MITLTRDNSHMLMQKAKPVTGFNFGFRGVVFINPLPENSLHDLVTPEGEPVRDWEGKPVPGKGAVFWNSKDSCWQAIPVDGKTCLIFGLGGDRKAADVMYRDIMQAIETALPHGINRGDDIVTAATAGGKITDDVYNSDQTWFNTNARALMSNGNSHFVEGRGTTHSVLFIPGESSIETDATLTPQKFSKGAFLIGTKQDDGSTKIHACEADVFMATYRCKVEGKLRAIDGEFVAAATCQEELLAEFQSSISGLSVDEKANGDVMLPLGVKAEIKVDPTLDPDGC